MMFVYFRFVESVMMTVLIPFAFCALFSGKISQGSGKLRVVPVAQLASSFLFNMVARALHSPRYEPTTSRRRGLP